MGDLSDLVIELRGPALNGASTVANPGATATYSCSGTMRLILPGVERVLTCVMLEGDSFSWMPDIIPECVLGKLWSESGLHWKQTMPIRGML